MNKGLLAVLSLVPVAAGYLVNVCVLLPVAGEVLFYGIPLLITVFWYRLGRRCGQTGWKPVPALLLSHGVALISLLVYLWQFLLETDTTRNIVLAGFSQMFSASAPLYLLGGIARLFESQPGYAGRTAMVVLQVIAVIYMAGVFGFGLFEGKKRCKG